MKHLLPYVVSAKAGNANVGHIGNKVAPAPSMATSESVAAISLIFRFSPGGSLSHYRECPRKGPLGSRCRPTSWRRSCRPGFILVLNFTNPLLVSGGLCHGECASLVSGKELALPQ
jgi:hypothetical protein